MFERIAAKRAKFFAVMDFTQDFHQVEVHPLFRFLTAFITFCGIFQFKRVPFGPKNAPSYFQQSLAYAVLAGLLYLIYVDDLIVYGVDEDDFIKNLRTIFERLVKYKCVLKPSKYQFGLTKIEYVGRVLFFDGSTMRDETIRKFLDFPYP